MRPTNYECQHCGESLGVADALRRQLRLKRREIYLFDEITDYTVEFVIDDIKYLEYLAVTEPITVILNSGGGTVSAGFALIDVIKNTKCPIRMVGLGEICSMACAIFVVGTKGTRLVGKTAWFMFHPVSADSGQDYIKFQKSRIMQAEQLEEMYDDIILEHAKIPKPEYKKAKDTELWIPAKDVIKYGIADGYYEG